MTPENDSHPVRFSTQEQIEQFWHDLAHDPQRQALETARRCIAQAPHLAEWLKRKIYRTLSDSELKRLAPQSPPQDGRIQAINELADYLAPVMRERYYQQQEQEQTIAKRRAISWQYRADHRNHTAEQGQLKRIGEVLDSLTPQIVPMQETEPLRVDWELGRISCTSSKEMGHRGVFAKRHNAPIIPNTFRLTPVPANAVCAAAPAFAASRLRAQLQSGLRDCTTSELVGHKQAANQETICLANDHPQNTH